MKKHNNSNVLNIDREYRSYTRKLIKLYLNIESVHYFYFKLSTFTMSNEKICFKLTSHLPLLKLTIFWFCLVLC